MAVVGAPGMQMPVVPPPAALAGAAPGTAPGGAPNPMAMLAQRGAQGGAMGPAQQALLMFLAGMGFDKFAATIDKLRGPKDTHHKQTGMQKDAAANPAMVPSAQLQQQLLQLAQRQAGAGAPMGGTPMPPSLPGGTPF